MRLFPSSKKQKKKLAMFFSRCREHAKQWMLQVIYNMEAKHSRAGRASERDKILEKQKIFSNTTRTLVVVQKRH